jgi:hypothetical protein
MNKLMSNNTYGISRTEAKKVERDAILDYDRNVNYQQELLNDIGKDLGTATGNLTNVVTEVKTQGETISRVKVNVQETGVSVKRADKNITVMSRRNYLQKCLLHVLAVTLFLANIAVIIFKIMT